MGLPRFRNPKDGEKCSPHLYVANCGPALGLSDETIASVFGKFGEIHGVHAADDTGNRVIVSYSDSSSSRVAMESLNGKICSDLGGRILHIRYSVESPGKVKTIDFIPLSKSAADLNIPGLYLMHEFITPQEEQELLAAVGVRPWQHLARRRVQHFGYKFCYDIRNVDANRYLGELPSFVAPVLERIRSLHTLIDADDLSLDQLTANNGK
ncbi:hypothetical protein M569_12707 [Genlisea aurea]|uniref:RRM domain-containing protein n=1 Tax=Genlisea aurea TaxID=192259 RepID=S8DQM0_9LAMI|nr:hypothetical protein M569_12707 [Genlisea aurea]